jgi:hypothetical protein
MPASVSAAATSGVTRRSCSAQRVFADEWAQDADAVDQIGIGAGCWHW